MKNKKVLIIEDERALRDALSAKFSLEGLTVESAKDGEEGLLRAFDLRPHIIILDIMMPRMNGLKMLEKLREDKWGREVPVIILTNFNEAEKITEAMENKVSSYIVKSDWKISDIIDKVKAKLAEETLS